MFLDLLRFCRSYNKRDNSLSNERSLPLKGQLIQNWKLCHKLLCFKPFSSVEHKIKYFEEMSKYLKILQIFEDILKNCFYSHLWVTRTSRMGEVSKIWQTPALWNTNCNSFSYLWASFITNISWKAFMQWAISPPDTYFLIHQVTLQWWPRVDNEDNIFLPQWLLVPSFWQL